MKRVIAIALALLLCGCAGEAQEPGLRIYYPMQGEGGEDFALSSEGWESADPTVETLVERLLAGPEGEGLSSPFPEGVELLDWRLEEGVLTLNFSEGYSDLTGISLTMANFCCVLTCAELEGVEQVSITVVGQPLPEGSSGPFSPDALLTRGAGENEPEKPEDHIDEGMESKYNTE